MASFEKYTEEYFKQKESGNLVAPIAPKTIVPTTEKSTGLLKGGAFSDGFDLLDIPLGSLATTADIGIGLVGGVSKMGEGIADLILYGIGGISNLIAPHSGDAYKKEAQKDYVGTLINNVREKSGVEEKSVLGDFGYGIAEGVGQVGAIIATGGLAAEAGLSAGASSAITSAMMGTSSMGSGMSEAYNAGATDKEALAYGTASGAIDVVSEMIFGGLGKGLKILGVGKGLSSADDMLAKAISKKISNKFLSNFAQYAVKAGAEGFEEVIAGIGSAAAKRLTYLRDEEGVTFEQLLKDENLFEQFAVGAIVSGIAQAGDLTYSTKSGRDFITDLSANEQKIVDKEVEDRIAEKEKNGEKLTKKEKAKIYDEVVDLLKEGGISVNKISQYFAPEQYDAYQKAYEQKQAIEKELESIANNKRLSQKTRESRTADAEARLSEAKKTFEKAGESLRSNLNGQFRRIENGKLYTDQYIYENFNEESNKNKTLNVDLSKYKPEQRKLLMDVMEKGQANNTKKSRAFWEYATKVAADRGYDKITTTTTKEILEYETKKRGAEWVAKNLKGKVVNGWYIDGTLAINVDSPKADAFILGHEVGHDLQQNDAKGYNELAEMIIPYAEQKEGKEAFAKRRGEAKKNYKNGLGEVDVELVNDLIGEYIYNDEAFIQQLSANPGLFKKVWNTVKYLYKMATAGSQQEKDLLRIKRQFEKVYRDSVKNRSTNTADRNTNYSFGAVDPNGNTEVFRRALNMEEQGKSSEEIRRETGWFRSYDNKWRFEIDDSTAEWHLDTAEPDADRLFKFGERTYRLGDILDHQELYKAYPQLKEVTVYVNPFTEFGGYVVGRNTDSMSIKSLEDSLSTKWTIIHEVQHLIQNIEGFARGASKYEYSQKEWGDKEYAALQKRNEIAKKLYAVLRRNGVSISNEAIEYSQYSTDISDEIIENNYFTLRSLGARNKRTENLVDEYYDQVQILNASTPEGQYHSTAGEIEAYDAQARMGMTAEERKAIRPNIDREGVIVKGVSDGYVSYALAPTTRAEVKTVLTNKNYVGEVKLTDSTPSIMLQQKGVRNLPMVMNASHIRENIFTEAEAKNLGLRVSPNINYHGLGEKLFLKVIEGLDNVTEAYRGTKSAEKAERGEKYFLLISQYTDQNGDVINIPVFVEEKALYNKVFIETNKIATVFGRRDIREYIKEQVKKGNLVRIKNRSIQAGESTSPINADYGMDTSNPIIPQNSQKSIGKKDFSNDAVFFDSKKDYSISKDALTKSDVEEAFSEVWDELSRSRDFSKYQNVKEFLENETDYDTVDYYADAFSFVDKTALDKVDGLFNDGSKDWKEKWLLGDVLEAYQNGTLDKFTFKAEEQETTTPTTWREEAESLLEQISNGLGDKSREELPTLDELLTKEYPLGVLSRIIHNDYRREGKNYALVHEEVGKLDDIAWKLSDLIKANKATEKFSLSNGVEVEVVDGIAVSPNVAEVMKSAEYSKPKDYMTQYSITTEPEWEKSYLSRYNTDSDKKVVEAIRLFTDKMVQDDVVRGYVPSGYYKYTKSGPLRSNVEYIVTFDMDTSCPRTFQFLHFRDAIQRKAGRYLTYNESINLLELMRAYGQQIPCCYCYVENKRVLLSASYNNFFAYRNAVVNAETDADAEKLMYGYNEKKGLPEASKKAMARWRSDLNYNPSLTEVWTATNTARNSVLNFLDSLRDVGAINEKTAESKLNKMVLEEFGITDKSAVVEIESFVKDWSYDVLANIPHIYNTENDTSVSVVDERALALNHEALAYSKSSSSAKNVENYVPYTDQLKNISQEDREYIMGMGGIRKHSSNDFRIDYVQDYFLFYADLAAGKWTGHTYTKSADFTRIFACTNDRINMSVAFYEDADGTIRENIDEGASWKDVRELRKAYKNVGAMAMVTSDAQLSYALNSDWIDMIIPFHASGLDKAVWYNLRMWNDYTSKQGERFYNADTMRQKLSSAGVVVPKGANASTVKAIFDETFNPKYIYNEKGEVVKPHFFPGDTYVNGQLVPGHHNDAETYFRLCEEYGVHPRFYGVKVTDTNGNTIDVTDHPSYLKLIKETSRTDSEQEAIQFNFGNYDDHLKMTPFEYAMKRLQEEANNGGFDNTKEDPYGVVEEFINEYLDKDRPLGYLTERAMETRDILTEMAKENFAKQEAIVDEEVRSLSISTETDAEYENAVNNGDMELAQRMRNIPDITASNAHLYAPARETAVQTPWLDIFAEEDIAPIGDTNVPTTAPDEENEDIAPTATTESEAPTEESKVAEVLVGERATESKKGLKSIWRSFVRNFVDKQGVFETLALKTNNKKLMAKANQIYNAEAQAQYFIGNGDKDVKSLKDIKTEVDKSGKTEAFYNYLYHKHNIDRMSLESRESKNLETLFNEMKKLKLTHLNEAQLKAIAAEKLEKNTPEKRKHLVKTVREYLESKSIKNKPVFGDSVTAEDSRAKVKEYEKANPEFKQYADDVYKYMNRLRSMLVEEGIISQETADLWADIYPSYVPIRREGKNGQAIYVPLDSRRTGVDAPIKRATGGDSDIADLFNTMAMRTEQTFRAIAKNRFGVELMNTLGTAVSEGETTVDEAIDNVDDHDALLKKGEYGRLPTFTVFDNGKKVTFEISEEMYEAMKPAEGIVSKTFEPLRWASNARRNLITEYNPIFMATNAIKDIQDVLMNSQHPLKTYAKMFEAYKQLKNGGTWYTEYMKHGGGQNTYFDNKSRTFEAEKTGVKKVLGIPLEAISNANNFIERAPRLAEYIASREGGASIEEAMLDAARVTTNFSAGGDVTKFLNRNGATFLNASVQGLAQQVRNVREANAKGFKGWLGLAGKFILAGLPAVALNALLWDDDDEYEDLSEYIKDNYYIVGKYGDGQFIRIPKGRTVAVIQDAFEQIGNAITGDDEVDFENFAQLVINNLAPNNPADNNLFSPITQTLRNKTWYGEDLVPQRLQDLPAEEQFDEGTDKFSKWLGETFNLSPYKINYLIDQYSGGVGDLLLPMFTPEAENASSGFLGDMLAPVVDKFTADSTLDNQNISDFYDTKDELAKKANSSKATNEDILRYKYMNTINSQISDLYKKKREIQNSNIDNATKYEMVREVQSEIDALAEDSLNTYNNIVIRGNVAQIGNVIFKYNSNTEKWEKIRG